MLLAIFTLLSLSTVTAFTHLPQVRFVHGLQGAVIDADLNAQVAQSQLAFGAITA